MTRDEIDKALEALEAEGSIRRTGEFRESSQGTMQPIWEPVPENELTDVAKQARREENKMLAESAWTRLTTWIKRTGAITAILYRVLTLGDDEFAIMNDDAGWQIGMVLHEQFFAFAKFKTRRDA
jgi:hypothetical protein